VSRRITIGNRSNGEAGVFVAPPGYDSYYAADTDLLLSIYEKVSSLLLMGYVSSSQSVALGYGVRPVVMLSSIRNVNAFTGLCRPSPLFFSQVGAPQTGYSTATLASDGSSMYVSAPVLTRYDVYNEAGI
jgi:hypothetical protein